MINKGIRNKYYNVKYNINRYILCDGKYYKIVGFHYISDSEYGYIVTLPKDENRQSYITYKGINFIWGGKNKIFLSSSDGNKYHYACAFLPW